MAGPYDDITDTAYSFNFLGSDGGKLFQIYTTFDSVNWWRSVGGIASNGTALVAWSDTATNVDGNFAAKGNGGFHFGNGGGTLFSVEDGAATDLHANHVIITPGSSTQNAKIGATNDLELSVGSSREIVFRANGAVQAKCRSPLNPSVSDRWWEFSTDGTDGFCRLAAAGDVDNVDCFLAAKGNGSFNIWNSVGPLLALIQNEPGEIVANSFLIRSAKTNESGVIAISGEINSGMKIQTNGTGELSLESNNIKMPSLVNYADDAAAATGGVPVGGIYRTASVIKVRVA